MNVFDLFARLTLDTGGYEDSLNDAGKKSSSFASKLKSGFATAAKVAGAGLAVATTAVTALGKASLDSYADYEQLVGGVETLFKESSDTILHFAENAYKTVGLSANQYMETVTGFSASLLQSLGGDTQRAADVADQAVTDMADNANKMGTSMESIQNAYQGFAKQNFTMLDNLKLGYGGTKEEMERLIADANAVKTANGEMATLSIESFADIVEAIHIVQTEMGITGTTAKEASSTISGSIASMKSAWSNLVTGIANENADLGELVGKVIESVVTVGQNIVPRVQQILSGIGTAIQKVAPVIGEQLPKLVTSVMPDLMKAGTSLLQGIISGLTAAAPTLITTLLQFLPELAKVGVQMIGELATGIGNALPQLIPAAISAVMEIVEALTSPDGINAIIDGALALILGLADGLVRAIPRLVEAIPTIIENLVTAIVENIPKLALAAVQLMIGLGVGIIEAIPELILAVPKIIAALVEGILSGIKEIAKAGGQLIVGFFQGIQEKFTWLLEKVKKLFSGFVDFVKGIFGIHSPSKVFAGIGENLALGLGKGWDSEFPRIRDEIADNMDFGTATVDFEQSTVGKSTRAVTRGITSAVAGAGFAGGERDIVINLTATMDGAVLSRSMYRYNQTEANRRGMELAPA